MFKIISFLSYSSASFDQIILYIITSLRPLLSHLTTSNGHCTKTWLLVSEFETLRPALLSVILSTSDQLGRMHLQSLSLAEQHSEQRVSRRRRSIVEGHGITRGDKLLWSSYPTLVRRYRTNAVCKMAGVNSTKLDLPASCFPLLSISVAKYAENSATSSFLIL
jgi:hypothetical protein